MARRKGRQNLKPRAAGSQRLLNGGGEVVLYEAADGQIRLDVRLEHDTVWLSQAQMGDLFGKNVRTISEHIRNVFKEKELDCSSVIRKFRITARDGKIYDTQFYNLDVIRSTELVVEEAAPLRCLNGLKQTFQTIHGHLQSQ